MPVLNFKNSMKTNNPLLELFSSFTSEAFRLETLPHYTVPEAEAAMHKYFNGELFPDHAEHSEWLDMLDRCSETGKKVIRVRVLPRQWTPYLNFEFDWGYLYNALHGEQIFVIEEDVYLERFGQSPRDWWMFDSTAIGLMNYSEDGSFVGAALVPTSDTTYLDIRNQIITIATPLREYLKVDRRSDIRQTRRSQ